MAKAKPRINQQITTKEVRVIDAKGQNIGVLSTEEALKKAKEAELDLIEVSPNAVPPVAKIMDYGKYRYLAEKKEKGVKKPIGQELKEVQLSLGISGHDLERKAKNASEFLEQGSKVKIAMRLSGRAKYIDRKFVEEKLRQILNFITVPWRETGGVKRAPRGIYLIIEKNK